MENENPDRSEPEISKEVFTQQEKQEIIKTLKAEIHTEIFGWVKRWRIIIIGGLSACSVIGFLVMCQQIYLRVKNETSEFITDSITVKFAEPNIKKTLTDVASTKAESIITDEIRPEVKAAKKQIENFEKYLSEVQEQYGEEYRRLAEQVGKHEERDRLMKLSDDAINNGNRSAYEELLSLAMDDSGQILNPVAYSEMIQVKRFYIGIDRVKGRELFRKKQDGSMEKINIDETSTSYLIQNILLSRDWTVRVVSARFLKKRKEKGVPKALLQVVRDDQRLDVVKEAIDAFEAVTGYTSPDVFQYDFLEKWWEQNKSDVEPKLKEQITESSLQVDESQ